MAGPPPPPAAVTASDQHLRMAEAIVIGMKSAMAAEREKKERFASHKKVKIFMACGLYQGEWDLVPLIYDMLK